MLKECQDWLWTISVYIFKLNWVDAENSPMPTSKTWTEGSAMKSPAMFHYRLHPAHMTQHRTSPLSSGSKRSASKLLWTCCWTNQPGDNESMKQRKIATYLRSIIHMEDRVSQSRIPPEVHLYIVKDVRGDALHGSTENTKEVFSQVVNQQISASSKTIVVERFGDITNL